MSWRGIHGHKVTRHQLEASGIPVEGLPGILESYLDAIERLLTTGYRDSGEPVEYPQLIAATAAAITVALATGRFPVRATTASCTRHIAQCQPIVSLGKARR
jgi:hypothetical protein